MSKNPIFQERKKNVKKPYFSGGEKKKKKTGTSKIFSPEILSILKTRKSKIFSPEILSIFFFGHEKIFGRKILSIWKKVCDKKKSFFQKVFANFLAFFPKKKKKNFFFSGSQNS